jgi:selenocysteine-specific elongation factor
MIIGTAGHIDHGKTALVHALTGVDTDRLKEEKARGISIELGYAYQPLENGEVLGFIDVPGHERFIHTMLAGAAGIDFALLVVAADDGIMPQTREHLDILNQLGVQHGAVALTKIDRVGAVRVAEVEEEVHTLLSASPSLASAPSFPVNALTGEGVESLRAYLHVEAQARSRRADEGEFRLAVDRSFILKGIGTVVTGMVFAGKVQVGDELMLSPSGKPVRLRNLHVMNQEALEGHVGQRCALNLAGADKTDIQRGDWVTTSRLHAPTDRFDALLTLSQNASQPLKHWTPVHLHLGAAHVMARVALLERDALAPGESALVQLVLDRPIGALHGDAFIVRDADAKHTLGGGKVLDPWAPQRKRRTPERLAELAALQIPDIQLRLKRLLDRAEWGLDLNQLAIAWNCPGLTNLLSDEIKVVAAGEQKLAFSPSLWQALEQNLKDGLADFHARFPDEMGPEASRARRMYLAKLPAPAFSALTAGLLATGRIKRSGPWLHLPDHHISLTPQEEALYERIRPWLLESAYDPPWVRDLAKRSSVDESRMRLLMQKLARQGKVYQVVRDLFYAPEAVAKLAAIVMEMDQTEEGANAATFRNRTGIGRKRCIQILEFFDRVGYTRRMRDTHRLRNPDMFIGDRIVQADC